MTLKEFVVDLFKDERGSISMKPLIGFMSSLFLCITLLANSFSHGDVKPSDKLVEAVMLITIATVAGDTWDKFSKKEKN